MVFAVAMDVESAKRIALGQTAKKRWAAYAFGQYEQESDRPPSTELGEPTRILDLPCAEWHEWSE